jgi:adenine phosphoribosyltransferase
MPSATTKRAFLCSQDPDLNLKEYIRQVADFPKPGILFHDISTLLADATAWHEAVHRLARWVEPFKPDILVGIESRGFLVAAPLALHLDTGFVMVRKRGKLPGPTIRHTYELEYGTDTVEIQTDAIEPGDKVVVLDDLLATGGTLNGAITLLRMVGAEVMAAACLIELAFLKGRDRLDLPFNALISYDE